MKLETQVDKALFIDKMEGAKKGSFGIDSTDFLMELVISKLYANVPKSIVREIISNAIDSHRRAGTKRRVQVGCPTHEDPVFFVRDFGTGMSRKDIEEVYLQIGASSKRASEDQIGGWGLGAKSPLAYGDFQIESVKDGWKVSAFAYRDAEKRMKFTYIEERSDQENGVEVRIPLKPEDVTTFQSYLLFYGTFWADIDILGPKPNERLKKEPEIDKAMMKELAEDYLRETWPDSMAVQKEYLRQVIENFEGFYLHKMGDLGSPRTTVYLGVSGVPFSDKNVRSPNERPIMINFENNPLLRPTPSREELVAGPGFQIISSFCRYLGTERTAMSIREKILKRKLQGITDPQERLRLAWDANAPPLSLGETGVHANHWSIYKDRAAQIDNRQKIKVALTQTDMQVYVESFEDGEPLSARWPVLINGRKKLMSPNCLTIHKDDFKKALETNIELFFGENPKTPLGLYEQFALLEKEPKILSKIGFATKFTDAKILVKDPTFRINLHRLPDEHPAMFEPFSTLASPTAEKIQPPTCYPHFLFRSKRGYQKFLTFHGLTREDHRAMWARRAFVWIVRNIISDLWLKDKARGYVVEEEYFNFKAATLKQANVLFQQKEEGDWIGIIDFWASFRFILRERLFPLACEEEDDAWGLREYCQKLKTLSSAQDTMDLICFSEDLRWVLESIDEVFDGNPEFGIEPWCHESD